MQSEFVWIGMAQTETLRTKVDNLQWEVNRLDAENRRLRDDNPETAARVDLEAELEWAKGDVVMLTERTQSVG